MESFVVRRSRKANSHSITASFARGFKQLGPGLITGAADDDPSGIATYSQAGAQFGLNMLWTVFLTYPLMVSIQMISGRIGRVTGKGLAANLLAILPKWAVIFLSLLLFVANTINIGADVAAMGAAAQLIVGWGSTLFAVAAAVISTLLQVFVPYHRYVSFLKWWTLVLFAYVCVVFSVHIDWANVAQHLVAPKISISAEWITVVVAVFGTTISPYLFFWQTSEEVEDMGLRGGQDLKSSPSEARRELKRIENDTFAGMAISNLIAFFIILTTAVTLFQSGVTDIQTSAQAAEALRPIAGRFAFLLFSVGIIGTGFLALPVLAGSAGYALAETFGRPDGLEKTARQAKTFYGVIVAAMAIAIGSIWLPLDPIKLLFWSAVINGVASVPILAAMMLLARDRRQMGDLVAGRWETVLGWATLAVMTICVLAMFGLEF